MIGPTLDDLKKRRLSLEELQDLANWSTGGINNPTVNSDLYEKLYSALSELIQQRTRYVFIQKV